MTPATGDEFATASAQLLDCVVADRWGRLRAVAGVDPPPAAHGAAAVPATLPRPGSDPSPESTSLALEQQQLPELAGLAEITAGRPRGRQRPDGGRRDGWYASPCYATHCCVLAMVWTGETQRSNGSWGRWSGAAEEAAYAVHVLGPAGADSGGLRRRSAFLADPRPLSGYTPPRHGRDVFTRREWSAPPAWPRATRPPTMSWQAAGWRAP